jgi:hypothetical protein
MWQPRRLTTLWASTACYKNSFTFFILFPRWVCVLAVRDHKIRETFLWRRDVWTFCVYTLIRVCMWSGIALQNNVLRWMWLRLQVEKKAACWSLFIRRLAAWLMIRCGQFAGRRTDRVHFNVGIDIRATKIVWGMLARRVPHSCYCRIPGRCNPSVSLNRTYWRFKMLLAPEFHMDTTTTPWLVVRKRTIPTERPPLVSEASANFCFTWITNFIMFPNFSYCNEVEMVSHYIICFHNFHRKL